jgi:hypothetical protein
VRQTRKNIDGVLKEDRTGCFVGFDKSLLEMPERQARAWNYEEEKNNSQILAEVNAEKKYGPGRQFWLESPEVIRHLGGYVFRLGSRGAMGSALT